MDIREIQSIEEVQERLERLVEARLNGFTVSEAHEYRRLIEREAELLAERQRPGPS